MVVPLGTGSVCHTSLVPRRGTAHPRRPHATSTLLRRGQRSLSPLRPQPASAPQGSADQQRDDRHVRDREPQQPMSAARLGRDRPDVLLHGRFGGRLAARGRGRHRGDEHLELGTGGGGLLRVPRARGSEPHDLRREHRRRRRGWRLRRVRCGACACGASSEPRPRAPGSASWSASVRSSVDPVQAQAQAIGRGIRGCAVVREDRDAAVVRLHLGAERGAGGPGNDTHLGHQAQEEGSRRQGGQAPAATPLAWRSAVRRRARAHAEPWCAWSLSLPRRQGTGIERPAASRL